MFEIGNGIGFSLGPVIGGVLYQIGGFRLPFIAVGGMILLFVIPSLILIRSSGITYSSTPVLRPGNFINFI